jgi:hypothetical protein
MASNPQSPLWNQDLVVAGGLAFAGMMAFEGKLFAAVGPRLPFVSRLLDSKIVEWWPVLLIAGGVAVWMRAVHGSRSNNRPGSRAQSGK